MRCKQVRRQAESNFGRVHRHERTIRCAYQAFVADIVSNITADGNTRFLRVTICLKYEN